MPKPLKTRYRASYFFVISITIWDASDNENLRLQNLWNGIETKATFEVME